MVTNQAISLRRMLGAAMKRNPWKAIIVPVGLHSRSLMERLRMVAAAYDDQFCAEEAARPKRWGRLKGTTRTGSDPVAA